MSEEKVIQHAKKAIHAVGDKKRSWSERIKEFLYEIIIIVLAVSITLWMHNWNDARHEHETEIEFLKGIKEDLKLEAEKLSDNVKYFQPVVDYYNTVWQQLKSKKLDNNYIDKNSGQLLNTYYYVADNGRFEGFKSSGYLRLIENKELLKDLMSLYTMSIPFQENIDKNLFSQRSKDYDTYIGIKGIADSAGVHVSRIINDPAVAYQIMRYVGSFNERKQQQIELEKQIKDVIAEIDKELNK
jgi:hypothetical protein